MKSFVPLQTNAFLVLKPNIFLGHKISKIKSRHQKLSKNCFRTLYWLKFDSIRYEI